MYSMLKSFFINKIQWYSFVSNVSQYQMPPVLYVVFNRLETVKRTFEAIRKAAPAQLFIAADGPRDSHPGEEEMCRSVRSYILDHIDWKCEVKVRFQEKNLGCRRAVSSAISWFFDHVEEGIILEDDCLPNEDFFRYAAAALEFYRNDPAVMHINGNILSNYVPDENNCAYLYRYAHVWGWASWRRAWKFYDVDLKDFTPQKIYKIFPDDRKQAARWNEILSNVIAAKPGFNTWDFQWTYTVMVNQAWCVSPVRNLISNIGTEQSTHNMENVAGLLGTETFKLPKTLNFPKTREDAPLEIEKETYSRFYKKKNLLTRIFAKISKTFTCIL